MKGRIRVQQRLARDIVAHVNAIPADAQKLPDDDDYPIRMAYGRHFYLHRAPLWCKYDIWTIQEAARLFSGMLPANDEHGLIFDQIYWSDAETFPLGPKQVTYSIFKLFKANFKCLKYVTEILERSPLGDRASPREWAKYARNKGLLPHDKSFADVDNSPLLCLLEPSDSPVLLSQPGTKPTMQPKSKSTYSTPLLAIQRAAIEEFFDPRRNPDAKSEEVVEWIIAEVARAGLKGSRKIAEAIFTIIKPDDHDPKKKRGNPL